MTDVRCKACGKLLGRFEGKGIIKCRYCKCTTEFNTIEGWAKAQTTISEWRKKKETE